MIKHLSILALLFILACQTEEQNPLIADYQADLTYLKDSLPAEHPNLFFHQSEQAFRQNIDHIASEENLLSKSKAQILMQLREAIAQLGDPHTNFGFYELLDEEGHFPIEIFWFDDGIWITGAATEYQAAMGKRLVAVNSIPIETVIEKVTQVVPKNAPYFSHKRMHYFLPMYAILNYYDITPERIATFTLADVNGLHTTIDIEAAHGEYIVDNFDHLSDMPYYWQSVQGDTAAIFKQQYFPADSILFVQYNSCWGRELEERFGDTEEAKNLPRFSEFKATIFKTIKNQPVNKVLFDLRFNGGGSSPQGTELITELSELSTINQKGKLFVATSQHTFSSAVINTMNFRQLTNAIILGQPTGGSPNHYGEVRTLTLPKTTMEVYHSTNYFKYVEGDLTTVTPDKNIPTTFAAVAAGIDPIYEYVKSYR